MYKDHLTTIRVSAGLIILMIGIIGIFLPILEAWILIIIAIPLISPAFPRRMIEKLKTWRRF